MSQRVFLHILLLDVLLYISLFWRDYHDHGQMLVAHYISFVAITDLGALFLPRSKRHWFNLFRFSSGISFLILVAALHFKGLDGEALTLTGLRALLCIARIAHAGWCLRTSGPGWNELRAFPAHAASFFQNGNRSEKWGCGYLLVGAALLYFPQLAYWTHYNWGADGLDDILTGLQAQAGLNFCIKLFVFEVLIVAAAPKLFMRSVVATLFVVQWPAMLGMFYLAPIPVAHAAVELYEIALVVLGYQAWRRSQAT
tara:strand:- start:4273 stop:5037 length:765 start_codon:yes stop_codon:yes gene_type:complete